MVTSAGAILFMALTRRNRQILGPGQDVWIIHLLVFLISTGIGSYLRAMLARRNSRFPSSLPLAILATMASIVVGEHMAPLLNLLVPTLGPIRGKLSSELLTCVTVSAILGFLPAAGIGAILSHVAFCFASEDGRMGRMSWLIPVAIMLGAVGGLVLSSRLLLPTWGVLSSIATSLTLLGLVICIQPRLKHSTTLSSMVLASIALCGLGSRSDLGYTYGQRSLSDIGDVMLFRSGVHHDLKVLRSAREYSLQVDGVTITSTGSGLIGEMGLAYFPRLLRPNAKRVLVVGLGSGTAASASGLFPDTKVVCCESEPGMTDVLRLFNHANRGVSTNHTFTLVHENTLYFLENHKAAFDLILVTYGNLGITDLADPLSEEFYALAKASLLPGGLLAHYLNLESFSPAELAGLSRTVLSEFPHAALVRLSESGWIIMASRLPVLPLARDLRVSQSLIDSCKEVREHLITYFVSKDVRALLANHVLSDESGLRKLSSRAGAEKGRHWRLSGSVGKMGDLALMNRIATGSVDPLWVQTNFIVCGCTAQQVLVAHELANLLWLNGHMQEALSLVNWGLQLNAEQPDLLADQLILTGVEDEKLLQQGAARIARSSIAAATRVAVNLQHRKQHHQAIGVLNYLLEMSPSSTSLWCDLGISYIGIGESEHATECFESALRLDPMNDLARRLINQAKLN